MNEVYGVIYKAKNLVNGKVYIGQTVRTLRRRKNEHERYAFNYNSDFAFHRALRKYGKNSFKWEVIDYTYSLEDLNDREVKWISFFNSYIHTTNSNGYNHTFGGDGINNHKHSEESKQKMSQTKKQLGSAKGSNNSKAKLTEDKVLQIKEFIKLGLKFPEIAKRFNVSASTVSSIKSGKTWSNVGEDLSNFDYAKKVSNSKLSENDVKIIKLLLKNKDLKQSEIAETLNTTIAVVHNIKANKRWKHVLLSSNDFIPNEYLEKISKIINRRK